MTWKHVHMGRKYLNYEAKIGYAQSLPSVTKNKNSCLYLGKCVKIYNKKVEKLGLTF